MSDSTEHFERLMAGGVHQQRNQAHQAALNQRMAAYGTAPADSVEQGRAARDISASYGLLGNIDSAGEWALRAYDIHNDWVNRDPLNSTTWHLRRERAMSGLYVAINGYHRYRQGASPQQTLVEDMNMFDLAEQTLADIRAARGMAPRWLDRRIDQYDINALRRVSVFRSLAGNRAAGLRTGLLAAVVAPLSESPYLATSTPELAAAARTRTKIRAFGGACGAIVVSVLASPNRSVRRRAAELIADRII